MITGKSVLNFKYAAATKFRTIGFALVLGLYCILQPFNVFSQSQGENLSTKELKKLSIQQLMNLEVTSVSKRPEKLSETASAIQVITNEDIHNFGATSIPEALYLAGNLQVAQKGSHSWGISARGFNTDLSNKLLVMMDGRTLYTPLFSGVFWERQDYLLNDIDRIEVISGPGSTLWGANAVNGVINIISKSADETQGLFLEGQSGNELHASGSIRYGGKITPNIFYRVYGRYKNVGGAVFPDSTDAHDAWHMGQGGFRMDAHLRPNSLFTLQGDLSNQKADIVTGGTSSETNGNILSRWTYTFSDSSNIRVQAYYDHSSLDLPTAAFVVNNMVFGPAATFKDRLGTFDIDFQNTFAAGLNNQFIWGGDYRNTNDRVTNAPALGFLPEHLNQNLFSVFAQDEIQLFKKFSLTLGSKLEHNDYTGFEVEPSARIRYDLANNWMVWAAVSRAVRTPSRVDHDITEGTPPYFALLAGNPDFKSETVWAKELGLRSELSRQISLTISLYYNNYDQLRSTILNQKTIFPLQFANGLAGKAYGFETSMDYQVTPWWQLHANYDHLSEDINVKEGKTDFNNAHNETADPDWQFYLRSSFYLPYRISLHAAFRWIDKLPINYAGKLDTVP